MSHPVSFIRLASADSSRDNLAEKSGMKKAKKQNSRAATRESNLKIEFKLRGKAAREESGVLLKLISFRFSSFLLISPSAAHVYSLR